MVRYNNDGEAGVTETWALRAHKKTNSLGWLAFYYDFKCISTQSYITFICSYILCYLYINA